jgi:hypothetical protein
MKTLICGLLVLCAFGCGEVEVGGDAGIGALDPVTAGSSAATPEVGGKKEELALAVYTIQNGGTIGSESTVNALRALAMGYGGNTADFWTCTSNVGTDGASCTHGSDVLYFFDCRTITNSGQIQRDCQTGLGLARIGSAHWTRVPHGTLWYVVYNTGQSFPGYAMFKSSPRQLVGCNMVTHPCPTTAVGSAWPIR